MLACSLLRSSGPSFSLDKYLTVADASLSQNPKHLRTYGGYGMRGRYGSRMESGEPWRMLCLVFLSLPCPASWAEHHSTPNLCADNLGVTAYSVPSESVAHCCWLCKPLSSDGSVTRGGAGHVPLQAGLLCRYDGWFFNKVPLISPDTSC